MFLNLSSNQRYPWRVPRTHSLFLPVLLPNGDKYVCRVADGHGDFSEYCLENLACMLAGKFPGHAVWVVLPKTRVHGVLASYDNFVKADWDSGGAVLECECDG